jgi:hypothetical protein
VFNALKLRKDGVHINRRLFSHSWFTSSKKVPYKENEHNVLDSLTQLGLSFASGVQEIIDSIAEVELTITEKVVLAAVASPIVYLLMKYARLREREEDQRRYDAELLRADVYKAVCAYFSSHCVIYFQDLVVFVWYMLNRTCILKL